MSVFVHRHRGLREQSTPKERLNRDEGMFTMTPGEYDIIINSSFSIYALEVQLKELVLEYGL